MLISNLKMNAFNDSTFGEPEQDANSALIELDKGLRSSKIGEQCQAIVCFPRLFEKYPFPILINSSLLKLADVFRVGSNFLRVWVLRVCQQSEKHLDKILNVDEFVRRIYSVMYSNDPVAKALTLRTLGSVARIIPERRQVHHSIRRSLDCHDLVQVEAAIYAAQMFAAQSKVFAIFLCSKISDMIRGQATPASMKLQLIPILQYMHHDISTASLANELCMELLKSYPAVEFVRTTLSASTTLASATLIDIPLQVSLLVNYFLEDPRIVIKKHSLCLLHSLAKKGSHLWPKEALSQLIDHTAVMLQGVENTNLVIQTLDVVEVLSQSAVTCDANAEEGSPLLILCSKACYHSDPIVAVKAVTILCRVACYCYEENLPVHGISDINASLESLIMLLSLEDKYLFHLKVCLSMIVKFCRVKPDHCNIFVDAITSTLMSTGDSSKQKDAQGDTLCEALGAIGCLQENILLPLLPDILFRLEQTSHKQTKVMLCTLVFQMIATGFEWNKDCLRSIQNAVETEGNWNKYRIARGAARYGHHKIARDIFTVLKETVASEHLHFWLLGLELLTSAESLLDSNSSEDMMETNIKICDVRKINGSISLYSSACAAFKAASTPLRSLQFPCDYAKLRCEFFQALVQLLHNCRSLCTSPPFAIAAHQAHTCKDELMRYGRVTTQLRKSVAELKTCAENYQILYESAFDADPDTLNNIKALQELCLLMAHSVQRVCGGPTVTMNQSTDAKFNFGSSIEMQHLSKCCSEIQRLAPAGSADNESSSNETSGISHQRVNHIISQVKLLVSGKMRLPLPRYFFQILQSTNIKLSVLPQPRVLGEPISVPQGSQLALKVEGVIRHGRPDFQFRSVAAINVSVSTAVPSKANSTDRKETIISKLEQTVVPHRDFFACEFLLSLGIQNTCSNNVTSSGGQYQVTVSANIVDKSGSIWNCGPKTILQIKVHEEPTKRKLN